MEEVWAVRYPISVNLFPRSDKILETSFESRRVLADMIALFVCNRSAGNTGNHPPHL